MKTRLLLASLLLSQLAGAQRLIIFSKDPRVLQGDTAFYRGEYIRSIRYYRQLPQDDPAVLFNLASAYVGSGQYDTAYQLLFRSGLDQIKYAVEFAPLHGSPSWQLLVKKIDLRYKCLKRGEVAKEINRRYFYDQQYQMMGTWKKRFNNAYPTYTLAALDSLKDAVMVENVRYIKRTGFLWKEDIGEEGVHTTWLIAQHADFDTAFQRAYLREMKKHGANKVDYAYLTDRVRKNAGEKQVYGTQLKYIGAKVMLWPVADSAHLDARRKEMGLPPVGEYLEGVKMLNNH